MRLVIQRVSSAKLCVDQKEIASIQHGFVVFIGVEKGDSINDVSWLVSKLIGLRVFSDNEGKMNHSILEVKGSLLIVSQFTLFASLAKGMRPSFSRSANPIEAKSLYDLFVMMLRRACMDVQTGVFGADMQVSLVNDGPVTITIDSKNKE
jgi:D-tyrosyl-tRNA(Tyr) deacylase